MFEDRCDAGRRLLDAIREAQLDDPIVLALPRGGVPVAAEVSRGLGVPLDVLVVRKLGVPWQPEFAFGAIASGGVRVLNQDVVDCVPGLDSDAIEAVVAREARELERRERAYRGTRTFPKLAGRTVVIVDDGLATGATMRASVAAVRQLKPARIVVAVPVGSTEAVQTLAREADTVICLLAPPGFRAVGQYYRDFGQTTDAEVCDTLASSAAAGAPS